MSELLDESGAPAGLQGTVVYATDLFDAIVGRGPSRERFVRLLEGLLSDAEHVGR